MIELVLLVVQGLCCVATVIILVIADRQLRRASRELERLDARQCAVHEESQRVHVVPFRASLHQPRSTLRE